MATKKNNEVAVVEEEDTGVAVAAPDFLQRGSAGTEDLGTQDMSLPGMKLVQGTTPGAAENGWRPGCYLHTILEEEVNPAQEDLIFTPILALKPRYILFRPLDDGGGVLARAEDGVHWTPDNASFQVKINDGAKTVTWSTAKTVKASGLGGWGSYDPDNPDSPPAADLQYRYICVSPSHRHFGPFIISLQRSALSAAKDLNYLLDTCEYDAFAQCFKVTSVWEDKGPKNKKFLWKFKRAGFVSNAEDYARNRQLYETMKESSVILHDEDTHTTPEPETAPAAGVTLNADGKEEF